MNIDPSNRGITLFLTLNFNKWELASGGSAGSDLVKARGVSIPFGVAVGVLGGVS